MNISADDQAISLINNMTNMINIGEELSCILNKMTKPSDIIENMGELEKKIDKIQKTVSVMMMEASSLKTFYKNSLTMIFDLKMQMQNKILERKSTDVQMNFTSSVYEEGNYITDFIISNYIMSSGEVSDIQMDTIIDPKDYSTLSLVNRMNSDDDVLSFIGNTTVEFFDELYNKLVDINRYIFTILGDFHNTEFIENLCMDESNAVGKYIDISGLSLIYITSCKEKVSKIFNIYMELRHNYEIYQKAVDKYVSLALECFFNDYSTYEIC